MAPPALTDERLEVHGYRLGDETEILALLERTFGRARDPAVWRARVAENPFAPPTMGLLFEDGALVGHTGFAPRMALAFGERRLAMEGGDTMLAPRTRGRGLAGRIHEEARSQAARLGAAFAYRVPNQASDRPLRRCGYREIGVLRRRTVYLDPLRALAGRLLSRLTPPSLTRKSPGVVGRGVAAPVASAGWEGTVDDLEARARSCVDLRLARDAASWRFRYGGPSEHRYRIHTGGGGAFVLDVAWHGARRVAVITDVLCSDLASPEALRPVVRAALWRALLGGADTVHAHALEGSPYASTLARLGFLAGRAAVFPVLLLPLAEARLAGGGGLDPSRMFFTGGDFDIA